MEIKVGFEIAYAAVQSTPMAIMLSIHPSRFADIVGTESIVAEPNVPIGFYRDSFGNVCGRLVAPAGGVTPRGSALVRDSGLPDVVVPAAQQIPIDQLPNECLLYLMASRYCETDKLTEIAWSLFGHTRPGWERVAAICTFVHNHVTFGYQYAHHMKSAHDVYEHGNGVCRDFAHLALTFCRCMNIPARYCTGYMGDIGISAGCRADGFLRLVRGLSVGPVVHIRCPPQQAADRPHPDGHRPRRRRCGTDDEFWPDGSRQVPRHQRRGLAGVRFPQFSVVVCWQKAEETPARHFPNIGTIDLRIDYLRPGRASIRGHGPRRSARRPRCGSPYGASERHRRADRGRFGLPTSPVDHRL